MLQKALNFWYHISYGYTRKYRNGAYKLKFEKYNTWTTSLHLKALKISLLWTERLKRSHFPLFLFNDVCLSGNAILAFLITLVSNIEWDRKDAKSRPKSIIHNNNILLCWAHVNLKENGGECRLQSGFELARQFMYILNTSQFRFFLKVPPSQT